MIKNVRRKPARPSKYALATDIVPQHEFDLVGVAEIVLQTALTKREQAKAKFAFAPPKSGASEVDGDEYVFCLMKMAQDLNSQCRLYSCLVLDTRQAPKKSAIRTHFAKISNAARHLVELVRDPTDTTSVPKGGPFLATMEHEIGSCALGNEAQLDAFREQASRGLFKDLILSLKWVEAAAKSAQKLDHWDLSDPRLFLVRRLASIFEGYSGLVPKSPSESGGSFFRFCKAVFSKIDPKTTDDALKKLIKSGLKQANTWRIEAAMRYGADPNERIVLFGPSAW